LGRRKIQTCRWSVLVRAAWPSRGGEVTTWVNSALPAFGGLDKGFKAFQASSPAPILRRRYEN
jgi:hypothetical protein